MWDAISRLADALANPLGCVCEDLDVRLPERRGRNDEEVDTHAPAQQWVSTTPRRRKSIIMPGRQTMLFPEPPRLFPDVTARRSSISTPMPADEDSPTAHEMQLLRLRLEQLEKLVGEVANRPPEPESRQARCPEAPPSNRGRVKLEAERDVAVSLALAAFGSKPGAIPRLDVPWEFSSSANATQISRLDAECSIGEKQVAEQKFAPQLPNSSVRSGYSSNRPSVRLLREDLERRDKLFEEQMQALQQQVLQVASLLQETLAQPTVYGGRSGVEVSAANGVNPLTPLALQGNTVDCNSHPAAGLHKEASDVPVAESPGNTGHCDTPVSDRAASRVAGGTSTAGSIAGLSTCASTQAETASGMLWNCGEDPSYGADVSSICGDDKENKHEQRVDAMRRRVKELEKQLLEKTVQPFASTQDVCHALPPSPP